MYKRPFPHGDAVYIHIILPSTIIFWVKVKKESVLLEWHRYTDALMNITANRGANGV